MSRSVLRLGVDEISSLTASVFMVLSKIMNIVGSGSHQYWRNYSEFLSPL